MAGQRPPKLADYWFELSGVKKPTAQLERINFRTADFCVDAQLSFDSGIRDGVSASCLLHLIDVANDIDLEYKRWINRYTNSDSWGYRIFPSPSSSGSFDYKIQTYRDLWVGAIWLGCLCKRAYLQHVLLHCLTLLEDIDPREERQLAMEVCKMTIRSMASSICASVPFMLGIVDPDGTRIRQPKSKALGGYILTSPLLVARWSVEEGSMMDTEIISVHESISKQMGIRSAADMAVRRPSSTILR
jgi:hypothetical protein